VRVGAGVDLELLEGAGLVVEVGDVVAVLPDEPDSALRVGVRVAGAGFRAEWDVPFLRVELRDRRLRLGNEDAGREDGGSTPRWPTAPIT